MTRQQPTEEADALRADIEKTREELRDTAQALSQKADVKGRAADQASDLSAQATAFYSAHQVEILAGVTTVVVGYLAWTYVEQRR